MARAKGKDKGKVNLKLVRCHYHPKVETNLRCGKCGVPICPKCLVQTPVGARCPDCARLYRLPTFQIPAMYYLRAAGAGLGMAIVCGLAWGVMVLFLFRPVQLNLNLLLGPGVGYVIGEVVSLAVNRKRGLGLAMIAGIAVVVSYVVSLLFRGSLYLGFFRGTFNMLFDLIAVALGILVAITRLR